MSEHKWNDTLQNPPTGEPRFLKVYNPSQDREFYTSFKNNAFTELGGEDLYCSFSNIERWREISAEEAQELTDRIKDM
ncbi:hypothetical protein [Pleionea sediminis]|uniref:hypothetical protein n=1 Tax=Pleionea sediminis TaxID=2569479 RepID=UPI0011862810|nr:hypothetical protein [Pleionea sediminis]